VCVCVCGERRIKGSGLCPYQGPENKGLWTLSLSGARE